VLPEFPDYPDFPEFPDFRLIADLTSSYLLTLGRIDVLDIILRSLNCRFPFFHFSI